MTWIDRAGLRRAALAALCSGVWGCAAPRSPPPVPALPAERIPAPPASTVTLIWQPGHYDWTGSAYTWVGGEWVSRAEHGPLWQDGSWRPSNDGWEWVAAHWL